MKALVIRGKYAGREIEVSQWCNDWFTLDPRNDETLTDAQHREIMVKPFSPTQLAFTHTDFLEIERHKNNGVLFDEFEKKRVENLGNYEWTFKRKSKRKLLTVRQALALLPEGEEVHTFLDGGRILVGADWSRESVEQLIRSAESCEIGGPACVDMGHGLVVLRKGGKNHGDYVFVKHDEKAIKKYL